MDGGEVITAELLLNKIKNNRKSIQNVIILIELKIRNSVTNMKMKGQIIMIYFILFEHKGYYLI